MKEKRVAIVIPSRNEEQYIEKCLLSVINQTYHRNLLKILVVDGQSSDSTKEKVLLLQKQYPEIIILENTQRTTPYALNLGIKNATDADYIMILGAHAELEVDYISKAVQLLNSNLEISCVGGILTNVSENHETEVISRAMSSVFGVGTAHFRTGLTEGYVDTVAFGMYRKEVFEKIGLFDEELIRNQDDEFNYRLIKAGLSIYLSRNLRAKYYVRTSYGKLVRQFFQYGYWKVYVNKKHNTITTIRQLIPFLFVFYLFLLMLIVIIFPCAVVVAFIPLILYVFLGIIESFRYFSNVIDNLKLLWTFFIMHTSYGTGYAKGIFDFYLMNKKMTRTDEMLTR